QPSYKRQGEKAESSPQKVGSFFVSEEPLEGGARLTARSCRAIRAKVGLPGTLTLVSSDKTSNRKRLFLVDAMAHVYRAFYAPMMRMNAPNGMPTKVPFLFANILKRLLKDYQPEYLAIVFAPPGATFRDKLFEKYKAQRQPMPDEMKQQLPYVRRLCEAMRMAAVEVKGYEADDVIGPLAGEGAKGGLEVLIVSNEQDMMQLGGGGGGE